MKYLEYISAATGIAKAKQAITSAHYHEAEEGYIRVYAATIVTSRIQERNACIIAADYDAMSKPCMEKLEVQRKTWLRNKIAECDALGHDAFFYVTELACLSEHL